MPPPRPRNLYLHSPHQSRARWRTPLRDRAVAAAEPLNDLQGVVRVTHGVGAVLGVGLLAGVGVEAQGARVGLVRGAAGSAA